MTYILAVLTLAGAFVAGRYDKDEGGYTDAWDSVTLFPDKAVHAVCAYSLCLTLSLFVGVWLAFVLTALAGFVFEWSSGAVKNKVWKYDMAADVAGALLAVLVFIGWK